MLKIVKIIFLLSIVAIVSATSRITQMSNTNERIVNQKIAIILGSTREGRSSDKIGRNLAKIAHEKGISVEIIDLRDYPLVFLNDAIVPSKRTIIKDPLIKEWSDKVKKVAAFIIISPEYNAGYPGVLKNALDSLYVEWNNKPVGLITYSGGKSGGTKVLAQLQETIKELHMIPIQTSIKIPIASKAFDNNGDFVDANIAHDFATMLDQIIAAL